MMRAMAELLSLDVLLFFASAALASLVVTVLATIVMRLTRDASLPTRHAICACALLAVLASPLLLMVSARCGLSPLTVTLGENNSQLAETPVSGGDSLPPHMWSKLGATPKPGQESSTPASSQVAARGSAANVTPVAAAAEQPNPASVVQFDWASADLIRAAGRMMVLVWLLGSAYCLVRICMGLVHLKRLSGGLKPVSQNRIHAFAAAAARELGLQKVPRVFQTAAIDGPLSLGPWKPVVVLPSSMTRSLSDDQLRGLLSHEIAHIARGDHWFGLLQRLSLAAYWWNPLVHRISAELSSLREQICDDLATRGADSADGYAEMLVAIAERAVGGAPMIATLGIFERPGREFSQRVCRVLDANRRVVTIMSRRMQFLVAGFLALMMCIASATAIRVQSADAAPAAVEKATVTESQGSENTADPLDSALEEMAKAEDTPPAIKWPKTLHGIVKDANRKPIAGATVRFDLKRIHEYPIGRWDEGIHTAETKTDENGEYRFESADLPALTHRPFATYISCTADGFAEAKWWSWHTRRDTSVREHLTDIKMVPGRVVRGRCVDLQGQPLAGAVVKAASDYNGDSASSSWSWDPRETNAKGEFAISVPRGSKAGYELWVAHPNFAPQRVVIPKDGQELADTRLQPGTTVKGTVSAEGQPVKGVVVVAESIDDGTLANVSFSVELSAKTDEQGNYQLPPLEGMYKIYLADAGKMNNKPGDTFAVSDVRPPLVTPKKISMAGMGEKTLDFAASTPLVVTGNVHWPNGEPVAGCEVKASYLPQDFGTGIWIDQTWTDKQGNYEIQLPNPISEISIHVVGDYDDKRKWHYAHPDTDVAAENKGLQFMRFKKLDVNQADIDWVLKPDIEDENN
jgi:beta-lactamase regulating signal transducer with metallopeptidase domain